MRQLNIDNNLLHELYSVQGLSLSKIAEALHFTEQQIKQRVTILGFRRPSGNQSRLVQETRLSRYSFTKKEVEELYITQNLTREMVAKKLNISVPVLKGFLHRWGITKSSEQRVNNAQKTLQTRYGNTSPALATGALEKIRDTIQTKYGVNNVSYSHWLEDTQAVMLDAQAFRSFILAHEEQNRVPQFLCHELQCSNTAFLRRMRLFKCEDIVNLTPFRSFKEDEIVGLLTKWNIQNIELNNRSVVPPYEIDIYLPDFKMGIEFNGDYWHREEKLCNTNYHKNKSLEAEKRGIFIYHIFEHEWKDSAKKTKIINQLKNLLQLNERKIYGRECEIRAIKGCVKQNFLQANHIQGQDTSSVGIGLFYKDILVAVMTFCRPRYSVNLKCQWELSRFCCLANTTVVGGASKMFKYFLRNYEGDIMTYSNIAKTRGLLYQQLGFIFDHSSAPNYVWCKGNCKIKTRYQTQMKNEKQTMLQDGWSQVYDCGNKVWVYRRNKD